MTNPRPIISESVEAQPLTMMNHQSSELETPATHAQGTLSAIFGSAMTTPQTPARTTVMRDVSQTIQTPSSTSVLPLALDTQVAPPLRTDLNTGSVIVDVTAREAEDMVHGRSAQINGSMRVFEGTIRNAQNQRIAPMPRAPRIDDLEANGERRENLTANQRVNDLRRALLVQKEIADARNKSLENDLMAELAEQTRMNEEYALVDLTDQSAQLSISPVNPEMIKPVFGQPSLLPGPFVSKPTLVEAVFEKPAFELKGFMNKPLTLSGPIFPRDCKDILLWSKIQAAAEQLKRHYNLSDERAIEVIQNHMEDAEPFLMNALNGTRWTCFTQACESMKSYCNGEEDVKKDWIDKMYSLKQGQMPLRQFVAKLAAFGFEHVKSVSTKSSVQ
jgi:hypothetical protein